MDKARISELIGKYNAMVADPSEISEIEKLIESGDIDLSDFTELHSMRDNLEQVATTSPSAKLDDAFYAMLEKEKRNQSTPGEFWKRFFVRAEFVPRLAFASVALVIGLAAGFFLRTPDGNDQQLQVLGKEVSDLKELMMLSLLEKESTTDRLKAVSLTQDMDKASQKVTQALLQTLNTDENVNVRLAALEALRLYASDGSVREGLIHSIAMQESPLVQIALAEVMVTLQAKSSVKELERIVRDENTPVDVKRKLEESIKVLI
jgi:hypothetical protein